MSKFGLLGVMALAAIVGTGGHTPAQPPPNRTPTTSPYLNLLRGGAPGINYYNLVRPQFETNSAINQLQQQVGLNRQGISSLEQNANRASAGPPPTGFVPLFQSQAPYFMTYGGGMMGGSQVPNRAIGGGLPRAMGVPTLGSPSAGGIGGLGGMGGIGMGRMGMGMGRVR